MDAWSTDGDPATRHLSPDALRLKEARDVARATVASRITARAESVARTPPGRYLGYIPFSRRYSQAVPPDPLTESSMPNSPPYDIDLSGSPYDKDCAADDVLLAAMADCAGGSSDTDTDTPDLVSISSDSPPTYAQESQPPAGPGIPDSPTFPDSLPPPVPESISATCLAVGEYPDSPTYPPQYPTSRVPENREFKIDYDETLKAIYRLNAVTNFLMGPRDRVTMTGAGHVDRQDVMEAAKTLRIMLDRMFTRLQCID